MRVCLVVGACVVVIAVAVTVVVIAITVVIALPGYDNPVSYYRVYARIHPVTRTACEPTERLMKNRLNQEVSPFQHQQHHVPRGAFMTATIKKSKTMLLPFPHSRCRRRLGFWCRYQIFQGEGVTFQGGVIYLRGG